MRFHQDASICIFTLGSAAVLYLISSQFQAAAHSINSSWIYRLFANLLGYGVVFIPGYIIIKYIHRINYIDKSYKGCLWPLIRRCIYGQDGELIPPADPGPSSSRSASGQNLSISKGSMLLVYCCGGLQASYLIWGLLQEKIMTQTYGNGDTFHDSQFLVFVNRILALFIAWGYLAAYERDPVKSLKDAPLYKYSFCAFSNIMSSWFQYEALKFVSFPTQVLAKSCKVIPVMLMGKIVSRQKYEFYEYLTAVMISMGMVLFLSGSSDYIKTGKEASDATTSGLSGLFILILYLLFDSFTGNWQNKLFATYAMSSVRMMAGVNLFSCLLTGVSLLQQGTMYESISFMFKHSDFAFDCAILSICSAIGQLFIYYTILNFGAVVFTIIMTTRQALSVLLSCIMYSHPISAIGIIGVFVVFLSIFLRMYCNYRLKQIRNKATLSSASLRSETKV